MTERPWPFDAEGWNAWLLDVGRNHLTLFMLAVWDPVGAQGAPEAADEYEDYVGRVFPFIRDDDVSGLADELRLIELREMGIFQPRPPGTPTHDYVAEQLIGLALASTWLWAGKPPPE